MNIYLSKKKKHTELIKKNKYYNVQLERNNILNNNVK